MSIGKRYGILDLLKNYSLIDIAIFIVMLVFIIRNVVNFYDWAKYRIIKAIISSKITSKDDKYIRIIWWTNWLDVIGTILK